jgi:hypothetical protein
MNALQTRCVLLPYRSFLTIARQSRQSSKENGMDMQPVDRPQYQIDEQASGLSPFGGIK